MKLRDSEALHIWGNDIPREHLSDAEASYLMSLPESLPPLEWVWAQMDRVWTDLGLDNKRRLHRQPIDEFYGHPVWLMNGIFSASDPTSLTHREAITRHIAGLRPSRVADVGGGYGELALQVAETSPNADVHLVEPFPTTAATARLTSMSNVSVVGELGAGYDAVVAQDVLEHVEHPVDLAVELARSVRPGGQLILANSFTPVIKCHLPRTFHLRRSFTLIMRVVGLEPVGSVDGAEHALVFHVPANIRPRVGRAASAVSRLAMPVVEAAAAARRKILRRDATTHAGNTPP